MRYTIADCGTLGGMVSQGFGINSSGHVTGFSLTKGDAAGHACWFMLGSTMKDLGVLGGIAGVGNSINSSDQVAGTSSTSDTPESHAFLYIGGRLDDLNNLVSSQSLLLVEGAGINDAGQITGTGSSGAMLRPFIYTPPSAVQDLQVTGQGKGINASGQVTGWCSTSGSATPRTLIYTQGEGLKDLGPLAKGESLPAARAFKLSSGRSPSFQRILFGIGEAFSFDPTNGTASLGTLGGEFSCGNSINRSGEVTGFSLLAGNQTAHAFLYATVGGLQDLGTLGGAFSAGNGVNAAGWVVGAASISGESAIHAFLFAAGSMYDLNSLTISGSNPFSVLIEALAINDAGQIVGHGLVNGEDHAFLATPFA
jgi:probable HAF family extracellular repeat protein